MWKQLVKAREPRRRGGGWTWAGYGTTVVERLEYVFHPSRMNLLVLEQQAAHEFQRHPLELR